MADSILNVKRSSLLLTYRCTLKCKLCASYAPYYDKPRHFSLAEIAPSIDAYFSIVDHVGQFSVSGGEPLLHKELPDLIRYMLRYAGQFDALEIITNGTITPDNKLIETLRQSNKICVLIDDYSPELSTKASEIHDKLDRAGIKNSVRIYYGDAAHCGGWVDFGRDFSRRWNSEDELRAIYRKCAYPVKLGFCFQISGSELHPCSRSRRCHELGILPEDADDYIKLDDNSVSIQQKKELLSGFTGRRYLAACAFCSGLCDDSPRFMPAEQLP